MSTNLVALEEAEREHPEGEKREAFLNRFIGALSMSVDGEIWVDAIEVARQSMKKGM